MSRAQILSFALSLTLVSCGASTEPDTAAPPTRESATSKPSSTASTIEHVDAPGARSLLDADPTVVVLDIRTPKEFAAGHLEGALNVDFYGADFADRLRGLDRQKRYLVHCRSGGRSTKALATFTQLEFAQITHLDGGIDAWQAAELAVEK